MAMVGNKDGQGIRANGFVGYMGHWLPELGNGDYPYCIAIAAGTAVPTQVAEFANQIYVDWNTNKIYRALAAGQNKWELVSGTTA